MVLYVIQDVFFFHGTLVKIMIKMMMLLNKHTDRRQKGNKMRYGKLACVGGFGRHQIYSTDNQWKVCIKYVCWTCIQCIELPEKTEQKDE